LVECFLLLLLILSRASFFLDFFLFALLFAFHGFIRDDWCASFDADIDFTHVFGELLHQVGASSVHAVKSLVVSASSALGVQVLSLDIH